MWSHHKEIVLIFDLLINIPAWQGYRQYIQETNICDYKMRVNKRQQVSCP